MNVEDDEDQGRRDGNRETKTERRGQRETKTEEWSQRDEDTRLSRTMGEQNDTLSERRTETQDSDEGHRLRMEGWNAGARIQRKLDIMTTDFRQSELTKTTATRRSNPAVGLKTNTKT